MKDSLAKLQSMGQVLKKRLSKKHTHTTKDSHLTHSPKTDYFEVASRWAEDRYEMILVSRNRYQIAFLLTLALTVCLSFAVVLLAPIQHTELVLVHHYGDGTVWIEPTHQSQQPIHSAQIESDLVRYITERESYSPQAYHHQFSLVNVLSNHAVAQAYRDAQNHKNPQAFIQQFGAREMRTVKINSIVFLDRTPKTKNARQTTHHNLAEVGFTTTVKRLAGDEQLDTQHWTAVIGWEYQGTPQSPELRWQNWQGFTVTHYQLRLNQTVLSAKELS